jgi:hypothetical protein
MGAGVYLKKPFIMNETEGIPLMTQYNGHGIFIAMEELGFVLMSVAFGFLLRAFAGKSRLETVLRWTYRSPVIVIVFALAFYSFKFGLDRHCRFEVAAISINWTLTIVAGILSCIYFKRRMADPSVNSGLNAAF